MIIFKKLNKKIYKKIIIKNNKLFNKKTLIYLKVKNHEMLFLVIIKLIQNIKNYY